MYIYSFFRLGTGETIAFFESPSLPPPAPKTHVVYRTFEHLAVEVPSREDVIVDHSVDKRQAQLGLDLESLRARDVQLPCGNCPGCW